MKRAQRKQSTLTVKTLVMAVGGLMLSQSVSYASDTELYRAASAGGAKVMLLLDNSGSMGPASLIDDYGIRCGSQTNLYFIKNGKREYVYTAFTGVINQPIYDNDDKPTGEVIRYEVTYCDKDLSGRKLPRIYFDRLSRLKMALIPMLARPKEAFGNDADLSRYQIGLSSFFEKLVSQKSGGQILYPVSPIDLANRKKMLNIIAQIPAEGSTPSANALTEAGAYMLGTRTASDFKRVTVTKEVGKSIRLKNGSYNVFRCLNDIANSETHIQCGSAPLKANYSSRDFSDDAVKDIIGDFNDKQVVSGSTVYYLMKTESYEPQSPYDYSGMDLAHPDTLKNNYYVSPIDSNSSTEQCDGNGLYFLTDGEPNQYKYNKTIPMMNLALTAQGASAPTTKIDEDGRCSSNLPNGAYGGDGGWACMGDFAKALNNENNPIKRKIAVGTAGFGDVFASLSGRSDCNSTSNDASNLCKLGKEGEGYGEGGFYYIQESTELADSIKDFIAKIGNKEIPAISTGTMAVPLDVLSTSQSRGFAYTPILDPKPNETDLWNGNLKKYYIRKGTVTADDAGNKKVFQDKTGRFATDTYDLWNKLSEEQPDKALPQVGGTYQNIFKNTNKARNLYVNVNNKLVSVAVETSKRPKGFNDLRGVLRPDLPVVANSTTDPRTTTLNDTLNNVLEFMGYPRQQNVQKLDDATVINGDIDTSKRNLGGVLHSIPQLVTYDIQLDDNGRFKPDTRQDKIIYGSMDGALHLIDDKTGKEEFTFIPKELLDVQSGALIKGKTVADQLPYGVDAPWNVTANYALSGADGKVTNYKAAQVFAAGGLRMGGSTYYNLDITDPKKPKLVYSLGSNYANQLQGNAATLQGMKNGSVGNSGDQKAFARMGQTWGKPAVGFVKVNGKRVMVNFLPGGYDMGYESPTYKPTSSAPAQGNAVYMVQVGEEKEDATTNVLKVETNSNSGKLLWWASYASGQDHTNNKTTRSTSLQQSKHQDMFDSIVTEIRTVDRDYDGLTDHIYFADLGGKVWRADINNPEKSTDPSNDTGTFRVDRVVKLLDVSNQVGTNDAPPRFFERPLFTATDEVQTGTPMGQITVGTGNRSLPVSDKRAKADAIYSFIDKDVFKKKFFCTKIDESQCPKDSFGRDATLSANMATANLTTQALQPVEFTASDARIKTAMKSTDTGTHKHGWYYVLDQWNTVTGLNENAKITNNLEKGVKGLKMFNEPDAQAGLLYVSIFNPNVNLMGNSCSATVQGATQRLLMCLPFGNCANSNYNNASSGGTQTQNFENRSVALAGAGIIDNIITQYDPTQPGSLFTSLQLSCEGGDCTEPKDTRDALRQGETGGSKTVISLFSGVNRDRVINPRNWWEK